MRNFHIRFATTDSDTVYNHSTRTTTGEFDLIIHQLNHGEPLNSIDVTGRINEKGELVVKVYSNVGNCKHKVAEVTTKR